MSATFARVPVLSAKELRGQCAVNILIIEDNPVIAMDLGGMLEDMGHHVCGLADTAIKGMEECALNKPDLVMVGPQLG